MMDDIKQLRAELARVTAERDEARADFDSLEYDAATIAVEWEALGVGGRAEVYDVAPRLADTLSVLAGNGNDGWARAAIAKVTP